MYTLLSIHIVVQQKINTTLESNYPPIKERKEGIKEGREGGRKGKKKEMAGSTRDHRKSEPRASHRVECGLRTTALLQVLRQSHLSNHILVH